MSTMTKLVLSPQRKSQRLDSSHAELWVIWSKVSSPQALDGWWEALMAQKSVSFRFFVAKNCYRLINDDLSLKHESVQLFMQSICLRVQCTIGQPAYQIFMQMFKTILFFNVLEQGHAFSRTDCTKAQYCFYDPTPRVPIRANRQTFPIWYVSISPKFLEMPQDIWYLWQTSTMFWATVFECTRFTALRYPSQVASVQLFAMQMIRERELPHVLVDRQNRWEIKRVWIHLMAYRNVYMYVLFSGWG